MGKLKYRQSNVQIWFLDEDLHKSAEYLTNLSLEKTLDGCFAALTSAVFYFIGVRNKKAYQFFFSSERKAETMDRFFPAWPFRKQPQFRYYTSRASKWTRACREHFDYVLGYMGVLLEEYEYRTGRRHPLAKFEEWATNDIPQSVRIPKAGLARVILPWKSLKLRFRRKDIIEGYRLQFMDTFLWEDQFKAYMSSNRDIPDFVVKHFHLDANSMIT